MYLYYGTALEECRYQCSTQIKHYFPSGKIIPTSPWTFQKFSFWICSKYIFILHAQPHWNLGGGFRLLILIFFAVSSHERIWSSPVPDFVFVAPCLCILCILMHVSYFIIKFKHFRVLLSYKIFPKGININVSCCPFSSFHFMFHWNDYKWVDTVLC